MSIHFEHTGTHIYIYINTYKYYLIFHLFYVIIVDTITGIDDLVIFRPDIKLGPRAAIAARRIREFEVNEAN